MKIEKLAVRDLHILTQLFAYNNVEQMITECSQDIQIFLFYMKMMF